ncbi:acyl-homoserine-lactone synthase [Microbulbifer litoralis]|uniref:acyl-homoserine-lactone synthase n=1 Tax=Microbulbifer litoralis TaxID=2933965 RepID=UPI0020296483|nr:acyl-homoserine-lactone synthase [Microbulbifer sp. GX H0434]
MLKILVAPARSGILSHPMLDSMFRLRNSVFGERLNWSIQSYSGKEYDIYDKLNPVYLIAYDSTNPNLAIGCWRMLPSTGPYMLSDVFTSLLGESSAPKNLAAWEVSRFAVAPEGPRSQFGFGPLSTAMLRALWCQARRQNLHEIVGVTTIPVERMLLKLGFQVDRFTPPKKFGKVMSIAFRLPIQNKIERKIFSGTTPHYGRSMAWQATVNRQGELYHTVELCMKDLLGCRESRCLGKDQSGHQTTLINS